ncbi:dentin sialophosphoprotein-like [Ylistrum balloti]|uniref:dentin sialophosphoprotein-like n=1 Tax=Ylistrum balloti TaxID=509963 RepID=UPI002905EC8E|nr:dentin sialophosphoprotein-like [Ylistrum balloti]
MATNSCNPNVVDEDYISMSLHEMFHIVGDQMTERDIKLLKFFCVGLMSQEMTSKVHDGFSFLSCMEKMNLVSESNFMNVLDLLRIINRHDLSQFVHLRARKTVILDPVCEYLETTFGQSERMIDKVSSESVPDNAVIDSHKSSACLPSTSKDSEPTEAMRQHSDYNTTKPCSISQAKSDFQNGAHCNSSDFSNNSKLLPQDSKYDSNRCCESVSSPSTSVLHSTRTAVCSSPDSLLPMEMCVHKPAGASMSITSKSLKSGDLTDNTGEVCVPTSISAGNSTSMSIPLKRLRSDDLVENAESSSSLSYKRRKKEGVESAGIGNLEARCDTAAVEVISHCDHNTNQQDNEDCCNHSSSVRRITSPGDHSTNRSDRKDPQSASGDEWNKTDKTLVSANDIKSSENLGKDVDSSGKNKSMDVESGLMDKESGSLKERDDDNSACNYHHSNTIETSNNHPSNTIDTSNNHPSNAIGTSDNHPSKAIDNSNNHPSNTIDTSNNHPSNAIGTSDNHPSKAIDTSNNRPSNAIDTSDNHPSNVIDTSNNHPSKYIDTSNNHPSNAIDTSNNHPSNIIDTSNNRPSNAIDTNDDQHGIAICAEMNAEVNSINEQSNARGGNQDSNVVDKKSGDSGTNTEKKEKLTCDIRLRVRAEVALQEGTLEGNIFSNKPTVVERQCEKFMQANTVLKSHDLGSIVCDIKFSDLTYLDAFWRDYINGSLLEALKGVFLTESLKQAVGHEAIKLLVNVDEDDYEAGRVKLLQNLKN